MSQQEEAVAKTWFYSWWGSLLIAAVLALSVFGYSRSARNQGEKYAREFLEPVVTAAAARSEQVVQIPASGEEKRRIEEQLAEVRARAEHYRRVMVYFYSRHYMAIATAALTGVIAAVLLLAAAQKGLQNASRPISTAILVLTGAAVYSGAFPAMFRQDVNAQANAALFEAAQNLEGTMLSYFATSRVGGPDEVAGNANVTGVRGAAEQGSMTPAEFIIYVDGLLKQIRRSEIGFDSSQIPDWAEELTGRVGAR